MERVDVALSPAIGKGQPETMIIKLFSDQQALRTARVELSGGIREGRTKLFGEGDGLLKRESLREDSCLNEKAVVKLVLQERVLGAGYSARVDGG